MADDSDPFGLHQTQPAPGAFDNNGGQGFNAIDYMKNFSLSALESIPELIGYTPGTEVQKFRQDYPISGFLSQVVPDAVPYYGWFKAARAIPKLQEAVKAAGTLVNNPFAKGALQAGTELAPFEAGRLALSQTPGVGGDKSFGDMLGDASVNLALGSGIGGLIHGIGSAGTRDIAAKKLFGAFDVELPAPLQAREMQRIIDEGKITDPDMLARANGMLNSTRDRARLEEVSSQEKYVGPIAHDWKEGSDPPELQKQLNRLFKPTVDLGDNSGLIEVRKFAQGTNRDFGSEAIWRQVAKEANLPPLFEQEGQYYRHITMNTNMGEEAADVAAKNLNTRLTKSMQVVDGSPDALMTQEADDGMYIIAKKIFGDFKNPGMDDQYVLFKTDQPGKFFPENDKFTKFQTAAGRWTPGANISQDGGLIYNTSAKAYQEIPLRNWMAMPKDPSLLGQAINAALPQGIKGADNEMIQRFGSAFREYFAPAQYQFLKSPRANWIMGQFRLAFDGVEKYTNELMNGVVKADPGKNLLFHALKNNPTASELGFKPIIDVPKEVLSNWEKYFKMIIRARLDPAELPRLAAEGHITPEARDYFTNLASIDQFIKDNVNSAERAVARKETSFPDHTYTMPWKWLGDTRVVLKNESNEIVGLASGVNRKAALANADAILKENPGWKLDKEYSFSHFSSEGGIPTQPEGLDPIVHAKSWMLEKQNLRGFQWDTKSPTFKEFSKDIEDTIRGQFRYQADISTDDILTSALTKLQAEDPAAYRMVKARQNDFLGVQSPFSRWQNATTDRVLGPILGPNSASKIAQLTNSTIFNFQLGALRLAYPVVNALQFVQTVNPELAFILSKAPDDSKAPYYTHYAVGGTNGPVGGMAVLNVMKVLGKSLQEMRSPSPELLDAFQRASNERVITQRLHEEFTGSSRTGIESIAKVWTNPKDFEFLPWLKAASEYLPAISERMSRTHAFTVGYITARDFLEKAGVKLSQEEMYRFARQFTEKSMFMYSAADKPRVFTTPSGSIMGLFKNWMFNYLASMGEYTKQGFVHNNWSPLIWQTGGTMALGGLAATPLSWAADQASKWYANKSAMEMAYEQFGGTGGDAMMMGLPAALTGISLYSNVTSPVANPTRDATQLFSFAAWDRMKQIGKLAGAAFDHWQVTGEHPAHDPRVRELLMRAFAPATVYRSMGAFSNPDQLTQLGTDRPLVKNVSPFHQALYAAGFSPVELDRGMAISQELYERKEKLKSMTAKLGSEWAEAEMHGDTGKMAMIMRQGFVWGVDTSAIVKSGMKNISNLRKDMVERQLTPKMMGPVRALLQAQQAQESEE
jgi:hypothetical protein